MNAMRRPRDRVAEARVLAQRGRSADLRGTPVEALGWYDRALAVLLSEPPSEMLADVLRWKATAHRECGDTSAADRLYEQSAEVARTAGYAAGAAHVANCRGIIAQRRGQLGVAASLYAEAAALAEEAGEGRLHLMVLRNSGILAGIRGDWKEAIACFEASLSESEARGDTDGVIRALNNIAVVYTKQRRFADAEPLYARVLEMVREAGDALGECLCEFNRAEMLIAAGRMEAAELSCTTGLAIADRRGDLLRRAKGLMLLARLRRIEGALPLVEGLLEEALQLTDRGEDELLYGEVLVERSALYRARRELESARHCLREARTVFASLDAQHELQTVNRELGEMAGL